MSYSRRHFLKAAGSGVVLTAISGDGLMAAPTGGAPAPFASEKSGFLINGKLHMVEYEARTTLWEVIAMKTVRSGVSN